MKNLKANVWIFLCLPAFLTACATERVVTVPEVVEVVRYERVNIPPELLSDCRISPVTDDLTFGQAVGLWADDRASLAACNGQLEAIRSLDGN